MIIYAIKYIRKVGACTCSPSTKPQKGKTAQYSKYWHTKRGCEAWCSGSKIKELDDELDAHYNINDAYRKLAVWGNHRDGEYVVDIVYED